MMAVTRERQAAGRRQRVSRSAAAGVVAAAWAAGTLLAGITPDGLYDIILLLLAAGAVGALLAAGFDQASCGLRWSPPSPMGLAVAVSYAALAAPAIFLSATYTGLDLPHLLLLAPLSGISQELLFRSAVLPALLWATGRRLRVAIPLQALLFAAWHILPALQAPIGGFVAIMVTTFIGGVAWGWSAHRDGTVVWVAAIHVAMLMVMSFFTWG
jgi:membrane protease YdiL (CAAX protease family)